MARGGYRPGAGRPRKSKAGDATPAEAAKPVIPPEVVADVASEALGVGITPLQYMLAVMRDKTADDARRDRMAIAAAPFAHIRPADERESKKGGQAKAAKTASTGKFAAAQPPGRLLRFPTTTNEGTP